ncbi:MAG: hypothetical protein K0R24_2225 [Gammaproteobacteria bacterium]|jgi:hypothetical protein|nr:hypothetical protein [Gammaproteobacteria bacterium]
MKLTYFVESILQEYVRGAKKIQETVKALMGGF